MFTGIVEAMGKVVKTSDSGGNRVFIIESSLTPELKIDQSISHNGACLTVESLDPEQGHYQVTAIAETLGKTMLGTVGQGDLLNLERSMTASTRVDGHFVQGHVDIVGTVRSIEDKDGSKVYTIAYPDQYETLIVPRGSICVNGISLTVAENDAEAHTLAVAIIPYTAEFTNIKNWKVGDSVNLEFDILGKYVEKIMAVRGAAG